MSVFTAVNIFYRRSSQNSICFCRAPLVLTGAPCVWPVGFAPHYLVNKTLAHMLLASKTSLVQQPGLWWAGLALTKGTILPFPVTGCHYGTFIFLNRGTGGLAPHKSFPVTGCHFSTFIFLYRRTGGLAPRLLGLHTTSSEQLQPHVAHTHTHTHTNRHTQTHAVPLVVHTPIHRQRTSRSGTSAWRS